MYNNNSSNTQSVLISSFNQFFSFYFCFYQIHFKISKFKIYALFDWCLRRTQRLQSDRSTSSSNPTVNNTNTTDSFGNIIIERQQSIVQSIDCDRKTTITIAATNGIVQHATQLATTVHHGLTQRYGYVLDNVQTEDDIGGNCDGGGGDSCQPPFNQFDVWWNFVFVFFVLYFS